MSFKNTGTRTVLLAAFIGLIVMAGCSLGQPESHDFIGSTPVSYERIGAYHLDLFPEGVFLLTPLNGWKDQPRMGHWTLLNRQRVLALQTGDDLPELYDSSEFGQLRPLDVDGGSRPAVRQADEHLLTANLELEAQLINRHGDWVIRDCASHHRWPVTSSELSSVKHPPQPGQRQSVIVSARFDTDSAQHPHLSVKHIQPVAAVHGC